MTKYKLEEFKLWLEIRNIPKEPWNWEKHLSEYEDKPEEFARLLEEAPTGKGKTSDNKTIHYYNDLVNSVIRWKREVDNKAKEAKKKKNK